MNELNVIAPYLYEGIWVFDDPSVGLSKEPFVDEANAMIDQITAGIPNAAAGFLMIFSGQKFPGQQFRLDWRRKDGSGNYYYSADLDAEGWLCPALLRYFDGPPPEIYIQVKPKPAA